jgi:hypothetical protein
LFLFAASHSGCENAELNIIIVIADRKAILDLLKMLFFMVMMVKFKAKVEVEIIG